MNCLYSRCYKKCYTFHIYRDKWIKIGTWVWIWMANNSVSFRLQRLVASGNIRKSINVVKFSDSLSIYVCVCWLGQPKVSRKVHSFKSMPSVQRRVIHELAESYGCQTESYDEEPNKNVVATAVRYIARLSLPLLNLSPRYYNQLVWEIIPKSKACQY